VNTQERPLPLRSAIVAAVLLFGCSAVLMVIMGFSMEAVPVGGAVAEAPGVEAVTVDPALEQLRKDLRALDKKLAAQAPRGRYIVIDRGNNRLWVRNGSKQELEATVSTGSGTILRESGGKERTWTFDTPPGRFKVLSERRNPVWVKPDWAFLEEGQQPPKRTSERVEVGSLGEWALDLGDGYMIHGTLYERLLGRSITHGCVRVGRDDLRVVAEAARPGTPVFIY
jgi:L,D-transpeptidase YbiS